MSETRLDPRPIMAALGLPDTAQATPVTGGADTAIWRVVDGNQSYALRVLQPRQAIRGQDEIAAMIAAAAGGVPVPRLIAAGAWQGYPAMLLSWCPGQTMAETILRHPDRCWELGLAFGRAQAAIHAVPAPPDLSTAGSSWIDWAPPDRALRARLQSITVAPDALLHLDYHPLNVLVADARISAVIDWANARGGDPRADLARTATILRFMPIEQQVPVATAQVVRRALTTAWRQGYREAAGPVTDLAPFLAWAGEAMIYDLSPRLGRAEIPWLTPAYLDRVRRWAAGWRRRAGL